MIIGIDATSWANKRGYGRFTRGLLTALLEVDGRNEYRLFLDTSCEIPNLPPHANVIRISVKKPTAEAASAGGRRGIGDLWRMWRTLSKTQCDVLLFPTAYSFVPVATKAKRVVIIHDVIPESLPELTFSSRRERWMWGAKLRAAIYQADRIVTVSEFSRRGLERKFFGEGMTIPVVGEAPDPVFRRIPGARRERTVIYVGGFGPHKNVTTLLRAFAGAAPRHPDAKLILAGENRKEVFHSEITVIQELIRELGLQDRVSFTGFLPDGELAELLNRAWVLALPSLMEGYGLPAIEAAACGCPVIATRESPLPEILKGGGIFVDPRDGASIEAALSKMLGSPTLRNELAERAMIAASALTWRASAEKMLEILESTARQS